MPHFPFQKTTSTLLLLAYANVLVPVVPAYALISESSPQAATLPAPIRTPAQVKVNRVAPATAPAASTPAFSDSPTVQDIFSARVFPEPFVPVGTSVPSQEENRALADAITRYLGSGGGSLEEFEQFLTSYPESAWAVSIHLNLGLRYFSGSSFNRAITHYEAAWRSSRTAMDPRSRAVADRAFGELVKMYARVGRKDTLEQLFKEAGDRSFTGQASELVAGARDGLSLMQTHPELAYRCGPGALDRILARQKGTRGFDPFLFNLPSTDHGTSLASVAGWAGQTGLAMQIAFREPGAAVLTPAVVHWKIGHFAALFSADGETYQVEDPTFGTKMTATPDSLDAEASGYFLVPVGTLPAGWREVSTDEAATVWGKGSTNNVDPDKTGPAAPKIHPNGPGCGMPVANAHTSVVSLNLTDTPVGYTPPFGPAVYFTLTYNQRETSQPSVPDYSNLGTKWIFNWLSFIDEGITVVSGANQAQPTVRESGGGSTRFDATADPGTYPVAFPKSKDSSALLSKTAATTYVLTKPDGSQMVFGRKVGSASPYRYFLTALSDPAGNSVTLGYDSQNRLTSITDALGQVTTFDYTLVADSLKITKVTDPFGRHADIGYDSSGRLNSITDVLGLTSTFTYASTSDFVDSMTTPYGTSNFAYGESGTGGRNRWLEIANALGEKERVECRNDWSGLPGAGPVPTGMTLQTGYQNFRNTLYWDRKAYKETYNADHPEQASVLAGAHIFHWLHTDSTFNSAASVLDNEMSALEGGRIWYNYPGQTDPLVEGTSTQPSKVGRVLDDNTTQLYQYTYNSFDKVTSAIDPLGRETDYVYATNLLDLIEVRQKTGTGASDYEVLSKATYNSAHQPLTVTDAAGQVTIFTYNTRGQPLTVTNAKSEVTTFNYNTDGYLTSVDGPLSGSADSTTFAYDGYGRVRTVTDSEGYAVTTDYDAFDRPTLVTYPDTTTQQSVYDRLDAVAVKDRRGRVTRTQYNAIRQPVLTTDPLGRITQFAWCKCGALRLLVDPAGNTTSWTHDVRARMTSKQFADGSTVRYGYEANTSRLKSLTDAKSQITNYQYFADDSVKQVSYTSATVATPTVSFTYGTVYPRLATITDGVGTTTYAYNDIPDGPSATHNVGDGRLATIDGTFANDTIAYTYDELGRVLSRAIDGANNTTTTAFDALGRVSQITNPLGSFTYSYVNATARLDHVIYPNSQRTNYSYYNNAGDQRLAQIQNLKPDASNLSTFGYTYDAEGIIQTWSKQLDAAAALTSSFKYDLADQLTAATVPSASSSTDFDYRYDKAGNRTSEQIDNAVAAGTHNNLNQLKTLSATGPIRFAGSLNEAGTVTVNGQNLPVAGDNSFSGDVTLPPGSNTVAIAAKDPLNNTTTKNYTVAVASGTARTLSYDLNGNMTADGVRTYTWDAADRLKTVTQAGNTTEFVYNGVGQRVQEKLNGSVIKQWIWFDEPQPSEERDASNVVTKRFYAGLGEQTSGTSYFYTTDHLGSVREMADSTGAVQARYDYDSYGRQTKLNGSLEASFGFTGFYRHQTTGLNLTLYRAYDVELGRWLSRDPLQSAEQRQGLNLYRYVANNPINRVDRNGELITNPVVIGVVAVVLIVVLVVDLFRPPGHPEKAKCPPTPPPPGRSGPSQKPPITGGPFSNAPGEPDGPPLEPNPYAPRKPTPEPREPWEKDPDAWKNEGEGMEPPPRD